MNSKTYTINGKRVIHRPLSPMQLIRIAAVYTEFQSIMKSLAHDFSHGDKSHGDKEESMDDSIDVTFIYSVLQHLEVDNPGVIVRLINTIFIDAAAGRPCYVNDMLTIDDFYAIDAPTFLEVVADFFTLNDVSKTSAILSGLRQMMPQGSAISPKPSETKDDQTTPTDGSNSSSPPPMAT